MLKDDISSWTRDHQKLLVERSVERGERSPNSALRTSGSRQGRRGGSRHRPDCPSLADPGEDYFLRLIR
jgi:hypothetical protein